MKGSPKARALDGLRIALAVLLVLSAAASFYELGLHPVTVFVTRAASPDHEKWIGLFGAGLPTVSLAEEDPLPAVLPGPLDQWAGARPHTLRLLLPGLSPARDLVLRLELFDSHEAAPPRLTVRIDGSPAGEIRVIRGRGHPPPYAEHGYPSEYELRLSADRFEAHRTSVLEIVSSEGSWAAPAVLRLQSAETTFRAGLAVERLLVRPGKFSRLVWGAMLLGAAVLLLPSRFRPRIEASGRSIFLLILAAMLAGSISLNHRLEGLSDTTGDEPWYLLITHSLATDGDIDIADEIARGDYRLFYSGGFGRPQAGDQVFTEDGVSRYFSQHEIGLPLLLAPVYGLAGFPGILLLLNLVYALTVAGMFSWLREEGYSFGVCSFVTLAIALSTPLLLYSCQVYPDPLAAAAILFATWGVLRRAPLGAGRELLLVIAIVVLPWLNARFALPAAVLWLAALPRIRTRAAFVALSVASGLLWGAFNAYHHGSVFPLTEGKALSLRAGLTAGWAGSLLDIQHGLIFYAPFYLAAVVGFPELHRNRKFASRLILLLVVPSFLVSGAYDAWTAGTCPPARYLVPFVPLLALPVAEAVSALRRAGAVFPFLGLAAWSVGLGLYLMRIPHRQWVHTAWVEDLNRLLGVNLFSWLPDFVHLEPRSYFVGLFWAVGAGVFVWLQRRRLRAGLSARVVDLTAPDRSEGAAGGDRWR